MAGSLILHLTFSFAPPQRDKATQCLACRVTLSTAQCVVTQMIMKISPGHARLDTLEPLVQALQMTTPTTHYGVSPYLTPSLPTPTPNPIDWLLSPQIFRCFQMFLFLGSRAVWVDRVRWDTSWYCHELYLFLLLFSLLLCFPVCWLGWHEASSSGPDQRPFWRETTPLLGLCTEAFLHLFVQVNPWSNPPPHHPLL